MQQQTITGERIGTFFAILYNCDIIRRRIYRLSLNLYAVPKTDSFPGKSNYTFSNLTHINSQQT